MHTKLEYKLGLYGSFGVGNNDVDVSFKADFPLVGSNLVQTNEMCGVFSRVKGCFNHLEHVGKALPKGVFGQVGVDGLIGKGKAVIFPRAYHCSDPLCPVCCYDWARRAARRALAVFDVFNELLVGFELRHVVISVPKYDWGESFGFLRGQVSKALVGLGVEGGLLVYHSKRLNKKSKSWYFSPHFHCLGYLEGGVFDGGLVRNFHNLSGYVVKNLSRRKSVLGTLLYQLSHAGVPDGHKHAVTWVGCCGSRSRVRLGVRDVIVMNRRVEIDARNRCPVCGGKFHPVCRVVNGGVPDFDYKLFEERFVLDDFDFWVLLPEFHGRRKVDVDFEDG